MKLIEVKEYKGFKTEFFVLPKTEKYLIERGVNIKEYLIDDFHWYEHILFEILSNNEDNWSEEQEERRDFKVIFYGIIEKWVKREAEGFVEEFNFDEKNVLNDSFLVINTTGEKRFGVREKILLKEKVS